MGLCGAILAPDTHPENFIDVMVNIDGSDDSSGRWNTEDPAASTAITTGITADKRTRLMYQLFGHPQSGSAAVEVALRLCDVAYRRVDAYSTEDSEALKELEALNPHKQVPTLQLPDGSVLTEAAAILIHLGLSFPGSKLLPDDPAQRAQAIRGLVYIAANCYTPIGIIDFPERWLNDANEATCQQLVAGTKQRLYRNWVLFADQFPAQPFLSGAEPGALDILAAVITKWSGTREAMLSARPQFYGVLERIDHHPRVAPVLSQHWPT